MRLIKYLVFNCNDQEYTILEFRECPSQKELEEKVTEWLEEVYQEDAVNADLIVSQIKNNWRVTAKIKAEQLED